MKKTTKTIITFMVILSLMTLSVYSATIYDMQKVNTNVEKPMAEFSIEYETPDGKTGDVTSNSKFYDSDIYAFDQSPTSIKVPVGTKIDFIDSSVPGDGSKITAYDFQVYTPSKSELYYLKSLDEADSMTLDEEGKYEFYLCVMDNYQRVNGYDNWSVNGNHRWLTKKQNSQIDKFWWYFTQVNVYVYGVDEKPDDEPLIEDPKIEDPEIEEPEDINHNPELHIIKPDKYYPKEITSSGVKANTIKWTYYDQDGDDFDRSVYELYKKNGNTKILIDKKTIYDEDDLKLNIEGDMGDKYTLNVYVYDSEGNGAMKGIDIEILTFIPKIEITNKDRTYIEDELDIKVERVDDGFEKYIDINYLSYAIVDENNKTVEEGLGILPSKLFLKEKYFEDNSYTIKQTILNSDGTKKTFESEFYIVPILEPLVSLEMINGYIGETKDTGLVITQKQSPLRGNLPEYKYNFGPADGYYEIWYGQVMKYKYRGLCYQIDLDERFDSGKTYKLVQYVSNGAGKIGMGSTNIQIKEVEKNLLTLRIVERDNNPLTPFDEIYPKEKIHLKAELISNLKATSIKSWIENDKEKIVYSLNSLFNGLVQMDMLGKYKAFSKVVLDNGEELIADVSFIVKQIEKPIIRYDQIKNTYYRWETFSPQMTARDINSSEEHPNGYEIASKYVWVDRKFDGLFKEEKLNEYENKRNYELIQRAFNVEFNELETTEQIKFYLDNVKPKIEVNDYYECSCGEEIRIKAVAYDEDGKIIEFTTDLSNHISGVDEHTKEMIIEFSSNKEGAFNYRIKCTDDSGDECNRNIFIKVNKNEEYPYIHLTTLEEDRLKENRYIQFEYGNNFGFDNNLYINDQLINGEISNDDYHLVFEKESGQQNIVGLYFKHPGDFEISNAIFVNGNEIRRSITFEIKKDEMPTIKIESEKEIYRASDTKEAYSKVLYSTWTDDEILKIDTYVDDTLIKTISAGEQINIGYGVNVLGRRKIYCKIYETHNYVPNKGHALYDELIRLIKNNQSNTIDVSILNMKPEVNFEIKNNNKIRIIK